MKNFHTMGVSGNHQNKANALNITYNTFSTLPCADTHKSKFKK